MLMNVEFFEDGRASLMGWMEGWLWKNKREGWIKEWMCKNGEERDCKMVKQVNDKIKELK